MNHVECEHRRILANKLAGDHPLSTDDYQLIRSLIERVLDADELRDIGNNKGERRARRRSGIAGAASPARRGSTLVQ
jgi:hypothetical protein